MNQLNILRESNVTLRTECESASKKARDLEARLKQLSQELEPAKEEARAAQAELNVTKIQMERLDGEVRRWQERNTQLLSKVRCGLDEALESADILQLTKYERIDPAEVQALNDEIARLKAEAASAEAKKKEAESDAESQAARACVHICVLYQF
jgi:nucleoprotein TPR